MEHGKIDSGSSPKQAESQAKLLPSRSLPSRPATLTTRRLSNAQITKVADELSSGKGHAVIIVAPQMLDEADRAERVGYAKDLMSAFRLAKWETLLDTQVTANRDHNGLLVWGFTDDLETVERALVRSSIIYRANPNGAPFDGVSMIPNYSSGSAEFKRIAEKTRMFIVRIYIGKGGDQ